VSWLFEKIGLSLIVSVVHSYALRHVAYDLTVAMSIKLWLISPVLAGGWILTLQLFSDPKLPHAQLFVSPSLGRDNTGRFFDRPGQGITPGFVKRVAPTPQG
jgi:hypothetical protein